MSPTNHSQPADWSAIQFPTVRKGGYDRAAVHAYVDRAAREIASLTGKLGGVVDTVAHAESGAGPAARVLALAERVASEVRAAADADAAEVRAAADADAAEVRAAAEADAAAMREQAAATAAEIRADEEQRLAADLSERAAQAQVDQAAADERLAATTAAADAADTARIAAEERLEQITARLREIAHTAGQLAEMPNSSGVKDSPVFEAPTAHDVTGDMPFGGPVPFGDDRY